MTKGERIRIRREELGLTQVQLAEMIGTSKQNMYKYENDIISNIPSDKVEAIAKALKTNPSYIMGWDISEKTSDLIEKEAPSSQNTRVAQNPKERKVLLLARRASDLPADEYDKIVQYFEDTIDLYLKARGIDIEL